MWYANSSAASVVDVVVFIYLFQKIIYRYSIVTHLLSRRTELYFITEFFCLLVVFQHNNNFSNYEVINFLVPFLFFQGFKDSRGSAGRVSTPSETEQAGYIYWPLNGQTLNRYPIRHLTPLHRFNFPFLSLSARLARNVSFPTAQGTSTAAPHMSIWPFYHKPTVLCSPRRYKRRPGADSFTFRR